MGNTTHLARKAGAFFGLGLFLSMTSQTQAQTCPAPDAMRATAVDRSFVQEKYFPGMTNALQSQGRISASDTEIIWHMTSPFDVKTIISPDGISQSIDNGPVQPIQTGAAGLGVGMARSMASLMRGQWSELKNVFNVATQPATEAAQWVVTLVPLDARLKSAMGVMTIKGCTDVESVMIERGKGDYETIAFGDNQISAQAKAP